MHKHLAMLALAGTAMLAACGSKTDANEKNFGAAMNKYFEVKGDLCLNHDKWPVDLTDMDQRLDRIGGRMGQLAALETAGLVKSEDVTVTPDSPYAKPYQVKRYSLTDAAKPFIKETETRSIGITERVGKRTEVCWGKTALDKVVKWEGPMKFGDYQEAGITYTYKVAKQAAWVGKAEVLAAFPHIKSVLDGAGKLERKHGVKLTSQGWEAKGLD